MSHVSYPVRANLLQSSQHTIEKPEDLPWGEGGRRHSMECVAFTNTMGKGNPGDRVDVDVSVVCTLFTAYCMHLITSTLHAVDGGQPQRCLRATLYCMLCLNMAETW